MGLAAMLPGCRDRDFRSYAVYDAPLSGFRLLALAEGTVKAGADVTDLGRSQVTLCPLSPKARAIELRFAPGAPVSFVIDTGAKGSLAWDFRSSVPSLSHLLSLGAYPPPRTAELEEVVKAVEGVMAGPKGTFMPGQTKALGVVRVDFDSSAPRPTFASCLAP